MKDHKNNLDSAMAGQIMSSWLPYGVFRKVIFLVLLVSSFGRFFEVEWISGILLVTLCLLMSPRVVGAFLYFIGRMASIFVKK